jgi:hypothetical protein
MWKDLWSAHSNTTYTSVGKTYNGMDIWLFSAGNLTGKKVLWDGELHGNEDKGSEILYLIAKWLLESNDTRAIRILEENCVMFIPVVNDMDARGNGNSGTSQYGVDLNRNFVTGWTRSDPNSDLYSGAYAVSEPETQVLRSVFSTYKPVFYVNMQCGAGPYAAQYRGGNQTLGQQVIERAKTIAGMTGITPYATRAFGSDGFAIGDAVALGVQSAWLIEAVGGSTAWQHLPEQYDELVSTYFPKCLAIFIAMCEIVASVSNTSPTPQPTADPKSATTPEPSTPNPSPMPTLSPSPTPTSKPFFTPQPSGSVSTLPSEERGLFLYGVVVVVAFVVVGGVAVIARKRR